jgi:hypothetical protein
MPEESKPKDVPLETQPPNLSSQEKPLLVPGGAEIVGSRPIEEAPNLSTHP